MAGVLILLVSVSPLALLVFCVPLSHIGGQRVSLHWWAVCPLTCTGGQHFPLLKLVVIAWNLTLAVLLFTINQQHPHTPVEVLVFCAYSSWEIQT